MSSNYEQLSRQELIALVQTFKARAERAKELDTERFLRGQADQQEAQELLRRQAERFRNLTSAAFEGIGISEGGKVVDVNDQLAQMFGYTRDELIGQDVLVMIAPESRAMVEDALLTGREGPYEHLALRKDGTLFDAEVRAKVATWGGRPVRVTAIRDITERKNAARNLQRQLDFNGVLNRVLSRFATCTAWEADAAVVGALEAIAQFIGADHAFVVILAVGKAKWSVTHEWRAAHVAPQSAMHQEVPMGTKTWCETRIRTGQVIRLNTLDDYPPEAHSERQRDAAEGAQSVLAVPIRGKAGKITGCIGLHSHARPFKWSDEDVTRVSMVGDAIASLLERKRTEDALRESEGRYRAVVEYSPEAIAVAVEERLVYVNPAGARMIGAGRPEDQASLIGRSVYDFVPPSRQAEVRARRRLVIERGVSLSPVEGPLARADGTIVHVEGYSLPFVFDGKPAVLSLLRDITARRRAEESLRELSHRLHRAQDGERRRIARELHDSTAQLLAAVMMNLGVLEEMPANSEGKPQRLLKESLDLVERCGQEVRTLAYLLHPPLLDQMGLEPALRSYVEGFSKRSGIRVNLRLPPKPSRLPEEIELALFRVVQEALGNINRHSGSRTASIRLARSKEVLDLEVGDQGLGIPAATLEAIRNGSPVAGVGLAAMQERLREVGGSLEILSTATGTRLRAQVPLANLGA